MLCGRRRVKSAIIYGSWSVGWEVEGEVCWMEGGRWRVKCVGWKVGGGG